jgi:hypothetical protein
MPKQQKTGKIYKFYRLYSLGSASSFSKIAIFGQMEKYYLAKTPKWEMFKWGARRG